LGVLILSLLYVWLSPASSVHAGDPPVETRPYLELPFAGDTEYVVTCGYGCYQHDGSMTYAVDFDIPEGVPILASAGGEVMAITWEVGLPVRLNLGDALILYIDHGQGWVTRYVHLDGITVSVGDTVEMGQIIGYSGKTGASGDHLHFELKYGGSLHSPSVPVDELFGGTEPVAGASYTSNNYPDPRSALEPAVEATASPVPTATPPSSPVESPVTIPVVPLAGEGMGDRLPEIGSGLLLSTGRVLVGEPVTATFTLKNSSDERLHLSLLGVAARAPSDGETIPGSLFFDRSITLNPGRSYEFNRSHVFENAGNLELFIFALSEDREWLPLSGASGPVRLTVRPTMRTLYLPALLDAPTR
jgi:hypothetical protein